MKNLQKAGFVVRFRYLAKAASLFRKTWLQFWGMHIGNQTQLPSVMVTWPHQVHIGNHCRLEQGIFFKFDGIWKSGPSIIIGNNVFLGAGCEFNIRKLVRIGNDCLIASGCKFIDHDHGYNLSELMRKQHGIESEIFIGNNVWLGVNVMVLKGVVIGDGAIVAAGAVVTKSILQNEIWGGVPAKKISDRR